MGGCTGWVLEWLQKERLFDSVVSFWGSRKGEVGLCNTLRTAVMEIDGRVTPLRHVCPRDSLTQSVRVLDSDRGMVLEPVTCSMKGAGHILADGEEEPELWP